MNKKTWTIIAVICVIAGCIVEHFSTIPIVDGCALAFESFGLCALSHKTLQKVEKPSWKEYVCVGLFIAAGFFCYQAGITKDTMTQLFTMIAAVIALIAGLIIPNIKIKEKNV